MLGLIMRKLSTCIETGGSTQMELEGAKRSFSFLCSSGVVIYKFVSDRHKGIAKWLRLQHPNIAHLYDIWHVIPSCIKKLVKASKSKGLEVLQEWTKGVQNHLYCVFSLQRLDFTNLLWQNGYPYFVMYQTNMKVMANYSLNVHMVKTSKNGSGLKVGRQELLKKHTCS